MTTNGSGGAPGGSPRPPVMPRPTSPRHVLIVVENLPVPLDRRVWLEATTLVQAVQTLILID